MIKDPGTLDVKSINLAMEQIAGNGFSVGTETVAAAYS